MKEGAQRIAIAEACGWKRFYAGCRKEWYYEHHKGAYWQHPTIKAIEHTAGYLPDYINDLNAMHEAEKVLTSEQMDTYAQHVYSIVARDGVRMTYGIAAPAAQRAEAFLKTLNLWKD